MPVADDVSAATRDVIRLGHPVLRRVAEPVPEDWFSSERLSQLADEMIATMHSEEGAGLAAPQIAESWRVLVYWVPETEDEEAIGPTVLVNPELRPVGSNQEDGWEGCLSVPGLRGLVPRYHRVKVKARLVDGKKVSITADGFHARVLQHETDHLDGIVYLDRMTSPKSLCYEEEWEKFILKEDDID